MSMSHDMVRRQWLRPRLRGETLRQWLNSTLDNSLVGNLIDAVQLVLSMVLVAFSVYVNWEGPLARQEPHWMRTTELLFTGLFSADYLTRLYAADNRCAFIFSFYAMVDAVTIAPVYLQNVVLSGLAQDEDGASNTIQLKYLMMIRVLRALRMLRAYRLLVFCGNVIQRQVWMVVLTVASLILCTTGVIQALEFDPDPESSDGQSLAFYDAMYYIVVTITTLGYGDISPKSRMGRVTIMLMITASMVIIPSQISKLSQMLSQRSVYGGAYHASGRSHVVVCGSVAANSLWHFLREFFHSDNIHRNEKVVVLCPHEPCFEMKQLLMTPGYDTQVTYLHGSAMLDDDLARAGVGTAAAAFILVDKSGPGQDKADGSVNLLAASLRLYNPHLAVYSQVARSVNVRHVQLSGANDFICVEQIKASMLAMSCLMPGVATIVANLVTTFSPTAHETSPNNGSAHWLQEYNSGVSNEIYAADFPDDMVGMRFDRAAEIVYVELRATLIAVQSSPDYRSRMSRSTMAPSRRGESQVSRVTRVSRVSMLSDCSDIHSDPRVQLYPSDYHIRPGDMAILICHHQNAATQLSSLSKAKIDAYKVLQDYFTSMIAKAAARATKRGSAAGLQRRGALLPTPPASPPNRQPSPTKSASPVRVAALVSPASTQVDHHQSAAGSNEDSLPSISSPPPGAHGADSAAGHTPVPPPPTSGGPGGVVALNDACSVGPPCSPPPGGLHECYPPPTYPPPSGDALPTATRPPASPPDHSPRPAAEEVEFASPCPRNMPMAKQEHANAARSVDTPGRRGSSSSIASGMVGFRQTGRRRSTVSSITTATTIAKRKRRRSRVLLEGDHMLAGTMQSARSGGATFKRSFQEFVETKPPPLEGHLVLIGMPSDLVDFVAPLRSRHLHSLKAIVVVSPCEPLERSHARIECLPQVYYLRGSPLVYSTLMAASIGTAHAIAILANPTDAGTASTTTYSDDLMVDADAITTLRYVMEVCEQTNAAPFVTVELVRQTNIKFLSGMRRHFAEVSVAKMSRTSRRHSVIHSATSASHTKVHTHGRGGLQTSADAGVISDLQAVSRRRQTMVHVVPLAAKSGRFSRRGLHNASRKHRVSGVFNVKGGRTRGMPKGAHMLPSAPSMNSGRFADAVAEDLFPSDSNTRASVISSVTNHGADGTHGTQDKEEDAAAAVGGGLGYVDQPSFASGRVCLSNMIDSIFGEAFRKPYVIPVVQRLLLGPQHDDAKHGGANSPDDEVRLHQVPVPSSYIGKPYVKLLGFLLRDVHMLPIALYRCGNDIMAPLPYVYTNPSPQTVLEWNDQIFVLSVTAVVDRYLKHIEVAGGEAL